MALIRLLEIIFSFQIVFISIDTIGIACYFYSGKKIANTVLPEDYLNK